MPHSSKHFLSYLSLLSFLVLCHGAAQASDPADTMRTAGSPVHAARDSDRGRAAGAYVRLAQVSGDEALQAERKLWFAIKEFAVAGLVEKFVEQYPNGVYRREADLLLARLRAENSEDNATEARRLLSARPKETVGTASPPLSTPSATAVKTARGSKEETQSDLQQATRDAAPTASPILVTAVQAQLVRVGCLNGAIDGVLGPNTLGAVRSYLRHKGQAVSTAPNLESVHQSLLSTSGRVCQTAAARPRSRTTRLQRPSKTPDRASLQRGGKKRVVRKPRSSPRKVAKPAAKKGNKTPTWAEQQITNMLSTTTDGGGGGGGGGGGSH